MRFIFTIADLTVESGGPPRSVTGLASALAESGHEVFICAGEKNTTFPLILPQSGKVSIRKIRYLRLPLINWSYPVGLVSNIRNLACTSETFIHDNMPWNLVQIELKRFKKKSKAHLISCTRGSLNKWCFASKNWKKRPFWNHISKDFYNLSDFIHVTSQEELDDVRALGVTASMALIRNATDIPNESYVASHTSEKEKKLLFLSRISKKKGLELLLNAWSKVRKSEWKLIIAGTDSEGYLSVLKQLSMELHVNDFVEFIGGVGGLKRDEVYAQADLFILPTFSENYGLAIAEALAHGLPVITTKGAPWKDIVDNKCGWWCDINEESIVNALNEAMLLSNQERKMMGQRGREYVMKEHSWKSAAAKMEASCLYVLGKRERPEFFFNKQYF